MYQGSETQAHSLTPADSTVVRLAQVTDCHILADPGDCLNGMNTRASFEAVCRAVSADNAAVDLLLATGDLSQDESPESYQYLAQRFAALRRPVFWLPGNHDDPGLMRDHLRGETIYAARQVLAGNWLILLLDSTRAGETAGHLADAQIGFLEASLQAHAGRHALVCLHHQPLPSGSEWIDRLGLQDPERLTDRVRAYPGVRAVLWGHVHQQWHQRIDDIEWMSTPSTCFQFRAGSKTYALDDAAPGYRWIELHADGSIRSEVRRLASADFAGS